MGNRAVITTQCGLKNNGIGVYLHWNGGRDSVTAFLTYCKLRGFRSPTDDSVYAWARFCQVVGNWFGGSLSLGVGRVDRLDCDNWDNGVYIVDGWDIVDRKYFENGIEQNEYDLVEMLISIDEAQPEKQRLGENVIRAMLNPMPYEDAIASVKVGSVVAVKNWSGSIECYKVCGFGENGKVLNGTDVSGIPYIDQYGNDSENINSYLTKEFFIVEAPTDEEDDEPMSLLDDDEWLIPDDGDDDCLACECWIKGEGCSRHLKGKNCYKG